MNCYHRGMPRAAAPLATVLLVLALAWQLAYWTWVFLAPRPTTSFAAPAREVDLAAVASLFGAAAPASTQVAATGSLRLKGVVAPTPGIAASAIFGTGSGRDLAVFVNGEVQPGVKLAQVHPTHVVLFRGGVEERLELEALRGTKGAAVPGGSGAAGFRINVARTGTNSYAFSRKELDDALRDPGQLNFLGALGQPAGGGVRMDQAPAGSLAAKLGLQPGDVIRKLNGQPVASTGDLARLYTQFATLNTIQAEVQRGSATVQLSYAIQP